jgi:hypothetical protein
MVLEIRLSTSHTKLCSISAPLVTSISAAFASAASFECSDGDVYFS